MWKEETNKNDKINYNKNSDGRELLLIHGFIKPLSVIDFFNT